MNLPPTTTEGWSVLSTPQRGLLARRALETLAFKSLLALLEYWLGQDDPPSPHTLRAYRLGLRRFFAWAEEHEVSLALLGADEAQAYRQMLSGASPRPLKPATVSHYLTVVRTFYAALHHCGAVQFNPFIRLHGRKDPRHPLEKNPPYEELTLAAVLEQLQLLTFGRDSRAALYPLLLLLAHTGLRISEALDLRWSDLSPGSGHITVQRGKGGKSRAVPLSPKLEAALDRLRALGPLPQRGRKPALDNPGRIFPWTTRVGVRGALEPLFAGFHGFHAVRKSFGTRLHDQLSDIVAVAEVLGHSNVQTTRSYVRVGLGRASKVIQDW